MTSFHASSLRSRSLALLACAGIVLLTPITGGCGSDAKRTPEEYSYDSTDLYSLTLVKDRKVKDLDFLRDPSSPLTAEQKQTFHSLHYFAPDKHFVFRTKLVPYGTPEELVMATSKDRPREMLCIGTLPFTFRDTTYSLRVYVAKDTNRGREWFVPFTDATTGNESYAAGRYLDLEPALASESVVLDFNRAYNPYCSYNDRYDCPIPPAENRLPFAVTAGEKKFREDH